MILQELFPSTSSYWADVFAFDVAVDDFERVLTLMDELELDEPARRWTILESLGWWHKILANTPWPRPTWKRPGSR
jgi:hypothetical protein